MFFIPSRKKIGGNTFFLHLLPAGTVFVTVLGLTLLGWRNANEALKNERENITTNIAEETETKIQEQLVTYEVILTGGAGLFLSSEQVTRADWKTFTQSYDFKNKYPGLLGAGYSTYTTSDQLLALMQSIREDGHPGVSVFPKTSANEHVVVTYYEPNNTNGIGYDQLSETERTAAIRYAIKTGKAGITRPLSFVRSRLEIGQSGFSMFLPVYTDSAQLQRPPENRSIEGFIFAPIALQNIFDDILADKNGKNYAIRIYDDSIKPENQIFESSNYNQVTGRNSFASTVTMDLYGRKWVIDLQVAPEVVSTSTRQRPLNSLIVGSMLSLLLSGFVLTLLVARTRVLAHSKQLEVQTAKDELLSLASHQLRTPATSVKQYIGMALEGFAGKLSPQQENLLERAYDSNERQLHIINEILYVAKVDAKGIVLTPRKLNMNKLLRDLVQEMGPSAKKTDQKIRLTMPKRQVYITADEHCLRMAFENMISNGLKYSHAGKTVSVKLTDHKGYITLSFRDRGIGIDSKDLHMLFQRFSRIPNEFSRQTSGSGIGLYLSQQLIELHDGKIEVESTKGKGTTFTVTLPRK